MVTRQPSVEILGYRLCRACENPVLIEIAAYTGHLCSPCWLESNAETFEKVELLMEGRKTKPRETQPPSRRRKIQEKQRRYKEDPEYRKYKNRLKSIRIRALTRVAALHPEDYAAMMAYERHRAGLEPWPASTPFFPRPVEMLKTLAEGGAYHAVDDTAEDVDQAS